MLFSRQRAPHSRNHSTLIREVCGAVNVMAYFVRKDINRESFELLREDLRKTDDNRRIVQSNNGETAAERFGFFFFCGEAPSRLAQFGELAPQRERFGPPRLPRLF